MSTPMANQQQAPAADSQVNGNSTRNVATYSSKVGSYRASLGADANSNKAAPANKQPQQQPAPQRNDNKHHNSPNQFQNNKKKDQQHHNHENGHHGHDDKQHQGHHNNNKQQGFKKRQHGGDKQQQQQHGHGGDNKSSAPANSNNSNNKPAKQHKEKHSTPAAQAPAAQQAPAQPQQAAPQKSNNLCTFFVQHRKCKYGDKCKYSHDIPNDVAPQQQAVEKQAPVAAEKPKDAPQAEPKQKRDHRHHHNKREDKAAATAPVAEEPVIAKKAPIVEVAPPQAPVVPLVAPVNEVPVQDATTIEQQLPPIDPNAAQNQPIPYPFYAQGGYPYPYPFPAASANYGPVMTPYIQVQTAAPPNSVACRFFLKGTCKYAHTCRFAHYYPALPPQSSFPQAPFGFYPPAPENMSPTGAAPNAPNAQNVPPHYFNPYAMPPYVYYPPHQQEPIADEQDKSVEQQ